MPGLLFGRIVLVAMCLSAVIGLACTPQPTPPQEPPKDDGTWGATELHWDAIRACRAAGGVALYDDFRRWDSRQGVYYFALKDCRFPCDRREPSSNVEEDK